MDSINANSSDNSNKALDCNDSPLRLTDLPEECLRLVLSELPLIDKFRLEKVCKLWQSIIYDIQPALRFTKFSANTQTANYCQTIGHKVTNDDWVPQLMTFSSRIRQSPINLTILEKVLQKCGQTIRVLNLDLTLINEEVFEVIANYCPHICCISLSSSTGITDECLKILSANYGRHLSHVNLQCAANRQIYFTSDGLTQFLTDCPHIRTLFLASIRSQKSFRLNTKHLDLMKNIDYLCAPLPDVMIGDEPVLHLSHLQSCYSLTRLIIDGVIYSETTVHQLCENMSQYLTQLRYLTLNTNSENPLDTALISLAKGCPQLEVLRIKLNVITISTLEALSYFSNLDRLDFGIWKPFETGLLSLTLSPLQYCPKLHELRLTNLLLTDLLLENIHIFCPNLRQIYLNNMRDLSDESLRSLSLCPNLRTVCITGVANIASDVTENGLINLLDTMSSLVLIEIPIVFDITDDLYSCFKRYAKKYKNNYLTFVCGEKGSVLEDKISVKSAEHKFSIVSKL